MSKITDTIYSKSPPKLRTDLKLKCDFSQVKDRPKPQISLAQLQDFKSKRKYIPYAFIRFSNEALTMEQSLNSILEFCDRGVLVYSDNSSFVEDDQSIAIAQAFVEKNPGFILCKYPLPIIPQYNNQLFDYLEKHDFILPYRFNQIDCLYNYALAEVIELAKRNHEYDQALLFKVDMDHVYCPNSLFYAQYYLEQNDDIYDCVHFEKIHVMSDIRRYVFDKFTLEGKNSQLNFGEQDHLWFFELDFMYDHFLGKLDFFEPFGLDFKIFDTIPDDYGNTLQNVEMDLVKDINRFPKHTRFLSSFHFFNEKSLYYNDIDLDNCRRYMNNFYKGQLFKGLSAEQAEVKNVETILTPKHNYRDHVKLTPAAQALKQQLEQQLANFNFIYEVDYDHLLDSTYYPQMTQIASEVETNQCEFRSWELCDNKEVLDASGETVGAHFGVREVDYSHYDLDRQIAGDFYEPANAVKILNNFHYQNLINLMTPEEHKNFADGKYAQVFPLKRYYRGNLNIEQIFSAEYPQLNDLNYYMEQYLTQIKLLSESPDANTPQVAQQIAYYQTEVKVLVTLANEFTQYPFVIVQSQVLKDDYLKQKEVEYALGVRGYAEYRKQYLLLDHLIDDLVRQENEKTKVTNPKN